MSDPAFDWGPEDRYRSDHGRGPYTARILCATDKLATMERWRGGDEPKPRQRLVRFDASIKQLSRGSLGWRRVR